MVIQIALYILICAVWAIPGLRKNPLGGILFYIGIGQVAMAAGLVQGALNRQSPQWEKAERWQGTAGSVANL
jgi:hypothetical protein